MIHLRQMLKKDIEEGYTFDLPSLRFQDRFFHIFLWGDLEEVKEIVRGVNVGPKTTENKYLPWYNCAENWDGVNCVCLEEYVDADFISDLPKYSLGPPKKIKGLLYKVPLNNLVSLDKFYENNYKCERVEISLENYKGSKIYTWMQILDDVSVYDESKKEYVLRKDFDLVPFADTNDKKYYTYNIDVVN